MEKVLALLQAVWILIGQNPPLRSQMELWPQQSLCCDETAGMAAMLAGPKAAAGGAEEFVRTFANLRVSP